jgi:hypothetical protein
MLRNNITISANSALTVTVLEYSAAEVEAAEAPSPSGGWFGTEGMALTMVCTYICNCRKGAGKPFLAHSLTICNKEASAKNTYVKSRDLDSSVYTTRYSVQGVRRPNFQL